MKYETPPLYMAIHVVSGMIAYFYPILIILMIGYQLVQLALNCRFFIFSWKIEKGNSSLYTFYKIMQYVVGYSAAYSMNFFWDFYNSIKPIHSSLNIEHKQKEPRPIMYPQVQVSSHTNLEQQVL